MHSHGVLIRRFGDSEIRIIRIKIKGVDPQTTRPARAAGAAGQQSCVRRYDGPAPTEHCNFNTSTVGRRAREFEIDSDVGRDARILADWPIGRAVFGLGQLNRDELRGWHRAPRRIRWRSCAVHSACLDASNPSADLLKVKACLDWLE